MKIKTTWLDIVLTVLAAAVLVGSFIYMGVTWKTLPEEIPAHFDVHGDIVGYENKRVLLTMPGISLLTFITFEVVKFFPQTWSIGTTVRKENLPIALHLVKTMLEMVNLITVSLLCYLGISMMLNMHGIHYAIIAAVAGTVAVMAIYLIRINKLK